MKSKITLVQIASVLLIMLCFAASTKAQMCSNGSNVNKGSLTVTSSWQNTAATGNNQKIYWTFAATAGSVYNFSNCNGTSEDTYLRLYNSAKTKLAENDNNGPFCTSQNASLTWTCVTSGTYYIELTHNSCAKLNNNQILSYRKCEKPGTPTAVAGSATGLTTATISWSAGSPAGSPTVTYYWVVGTSASVTYGSGVAQGSTTATTATASGLNCGTTYYARVYSSSDCNGTATAYGTSVSFTTPVPAAPANVTATPAILSCPGTVQLNATSSGNNIKWYTTASGGTEIGTSASGANFAASVLSTTTYYAEVYNGSCTNPNRVAVSITVNLPAAPVSVSATPSTVDCGNTSRLNASAAGNTINWYTAASGGTLAGTSASGADFTVSPLQTTTYYAEATNGSCNSLTRTAVVVTVNSPAPPSQVIATPASVCTGSVCDLSATAAGYSIRWYDAASGGNIIGTSASDSLFTITGDSTITLYAEAWLSESCLSATRTPVVINVSVNPVAGTVTGGGQICPGNMTGPLTLTGFSGSIAGWEMSNDQGSSWTPIASTDSIYTTGLTAGGTYWFRAEVANGACPSQKSVWAEVLVPTIQGIAMTTQNSISCNIVSPNNWVNLLDADNNLIVSIFDSSGNNNLGNTMAFLSIDPMVQFHPVTAEPYLQRHVKVMVASQGGAFVKLYFTQDELYALMALAPSIQSASDLAVTKFSDMSTWSNPKYFPDPIITQNDPFPGVYSVQVGVTEFSDFIIHGKSGQGPLPIELVSFEAECKNGSAILTWSTATESNNQYFTIERTADMKTWVEAARIEGAGNSNKLITYSTTDEYQADGLVYYRLKQTDYDGKSTTSAAVPVNCQESQKLEVNYYPNPCRDELLVSFSNQISKSANVMMYDASAKVVMAKVLSENEIQRGITILNVSEINPGVYTVEFLSGKSKKAMTVIKSK